MRNSLEKIRQNNFMAHFVKIDDILKDMCRMIESSQKVAYQAINTWFVQRDLIFESPLNTLSFPPPFCIINKKRRRIRRTSYVFI